MQVDQEIAQQQTPGKSRTRFVRRRAPASDALSEEARARLEQLIAEFNPLGHMIARTHRRKLKNGRGADAGHTSEKRCQERRRSKSTSRDIRVPAAGDCLRRRYKDRDILVRVLESGFEFEGTRYRSLSAIAKAVTGAHWNGLLFFGLVRQEKAAS